VRERSETTIGEHTPSYRGVAVASSGLLSRARLNIPVMQTPSHAVPKTKQRRPVTVRFRIP
jgi:hypothetical protein